jgi:hypothetical protein
LLAEIYNDPDIDGIYEKSPEKLLKEIEQKIKKVKREDLEKEIIKLFIKEVEFEYLEKIISTVKGLKNFKEKNKNRIKRK